MEVPSNKTIRISLEKKISDYKKAGNSAQVDRGLDKYPYGKERISISLERAHEVARRSLRRAKQPTEEIERVTQDMDGA